MKKNIVIFLLCFMFSFYAKFGFCYPVYECDYENVFASVEITTWDGWYYTSEGDAYFGYRCGSYPTEFVDYCKFDSDLKSYNKLEIWDRMTYDAYTVECFANTTCKADFLAGMSTTKDSDSDGQSDYDEVNCNGDLYDPNVQGVCGDDIDSDGIPNVVEILIGTDPEVPTDFVSGDFSTYSIENQEPTDQAFAIVVQLTDGTFIELDYFELDAMQPFANPDVYTLGDYGDIPDSVDISLARVVTIDEIRFYYPFETLANNDDIVGDSPFFTVSELVNAPTSSVTVGTGINVINELDNNDTAVESWLNLMNVLDGVPTLSVPTVAEGVAQGIVLVGESITPSEIPGINEIEDSVIKTALEGATTALNDFGNTDFTEGEVLTNTGRGAVLDSISWVNSLYQVPSINKQSLFVVQGWTFAGLDFPDMELDFDYPIVPVIRMLFLFFFYLSCVWIFFKLTRYGWG